MSILLETNRFIVKPTELAEYDNVCALLTDPEVMRYIARGVRTPEAVMTGMQNMMQHQDKRQFSIGNVYLKETNTFVGRAGSIYLELNDTQPDIELGYTFHKKYWGQGYATEIATGFLQWGFEHLPVKKLVGVTDPRNTASKHVLEKAGMRYVGRANCYNMEVDRFEIMK